MKAQVFLQAEGGDPQDGLPGEDAQDHDIFISLTGTLYVIVNSRKEKGKALKEHILKDIVPRGFDARIEEIQGKHQQAIEEKDAALALLNDDVQEQGNRTQTIQYENVALQAQKANIRPSYKNVKIPSSILKHVMQIMQEILVKTTLSSLYVSMQRLPTISSMACHIMSQGYNDVRGMFIKMV